MTRKHNYSDHEESPDWLTMFYLYHLDASVFFFLVVVAECNMEDIVFLVDSSGSIYNYNWPTILDFMKNLVQVYPVSMFDSEIP